MITRGVIQYPLKQLGLCASITIAPYNTTTEVYPDSPRTTPEQCNAAQECPLNLSQSGLQNSRRPFEAGEEDIIKHRGRDQRQD